MPQDYIHSYVVGVAGVVILDRPGSLNALNNNMVWLLFDIFDKWKHDPAVGHVVICSSSSKSFSVGGDVREVRNSIIAGETAAADRFFKGEYLADLAVAEFGKPIISLCDGLLMGGGAGLAQHSSHIVMTETTRFAMPESSIGLFPDAGASMFLGRCPPPVARLLGMTGYVVDGAACSTLGLATAIVPSKKINNLRLALMACKSASIDEVIFSHQMNVGVPTLYRHIPRINYIFDGNLQPEEMQERAEEVYQFQPNDLFIK